MDSNDLEVVSVENLVPSSDTPLLEWLRSVASDELISEISKCDRGQDRETNKAAIREQLESPTKLGMMRGIPREVLELERWSDPDREIGDLVLLRQAHIKRLLACTILLRNVAYTISDQPLSQEEVFIASSAATVVPFVNSSICLGTDIVLQSLSFVYWTYQRQGHPLFRPFLHFGTLLIESHLALDGTLPRTRLASRVKLMQRDEAQARDLLGWRTKSSRWLMGLSTYEDQSAERHRWLRTARQIFQGLYNTHDSVTALLRGVEASLAEPENAGPCV